MNEPTDAEVDQLVQRAWRELQERKNTDRKPPAKWVVSGAMLMALGLRFKYGTHISMDCNMRLILFGIAVDNRIERNSLATEDEE